MLSLYVAADYFCFGNYSGQTPCSLRCDTLDGLLPPQPHGCYPLDPVSWATSGSLLVLDALSFEDPSAGRIGYFACAGMCFNIPGCKSWLFCDSGSGCGSGCAAYIADKPPQRFYSLDYLPVLMFGASHTCRRDAWPYQMCALSSKNLPPGYPQDSAGNRGPQVCALPGVIEHL